MPFHQRYVIAKSKIVDYLLNLEHPRGGSKARFFLAFGFSRDRPEEFADALAEHPTAPQSIPLDFADAGVLKVVFEGPISTPDGRSPQVGTVWRVEADGTARLITATPRHALRNVPV